MNVSIFKTIKDTTGGHEVAINDVFDAIVHGQWVEHVERVRSTTDKTEQRELKKVVPYFTASGTFTHRRDDGIKHHSGIIAIDFDNLDDVNDVKSFIGCDRFSWFTCISVSGGGLCVFVKIDPNRHRESFDFLSDYYLTNYGLQIDQACKDISRPRFVTFDPDAVLNVSAVRLDLDREKQFDPEKILSIAENMIRNSTPGERHNKLLKASRLMGGYIGSGLIDEFEADQRLQSVWCEREFDPGYNFKQTIIDGIKYGKSAPITAEHFHEQIKKSAENKKHIAQVYAQARAINRAGREYDGNDIVAMCETYLLNKTRVEQIFRDVFEMEKIYFDFDNKPKHVKTEIVIADKWEFRRNVVTQSTDCRVRADQNAKFEKVNFDTVTRFALHCGQITSVDKIKSLLRSDFVPDYDPLKSYFLNLHDWDGSRDFISDYANFIQTDDQQFWLTMFKKHIVRCVAQIMNHDVNRFVCVLVGEKQATGKSTFVRSLSPFPGGQYYTESKVRDDKDGQFAFAENFIYNIEELSDMKNTDVNRLKAIISQTIIKERKPYAHDVEPVVRRANFFGSTNNAQFLTDTENTRWLCHNIQSIGWGYSKIDIHDLWAQAFALWKSGFDFQLTADENEHQRQHNKTHEVSDVGKELIARYFKVCDKNAQGAKFYTIADIVQQLTFNTNGGIKFNDRIIGKNMIQLGFNADRKRVNGNIVRGYYAQEIKGQYTDTDEIDVSELENAKPF